MLVLEPPTVAPDPSWSIKTMESEIGDAVGATKLDLELQLDERPQGHIDGRLIYDRDLFEAATASRMAEHFSRLLGAVAADPTLTVSNVPILTPAEEHCQLVEWNATTTRRPPGNSRPAASASARSIAASSSFTRMRNAWKLRVAG